MKDVDSRVFTKMLRKDGQTDSSVTISLCNFVGEGIKSNWKLKGNINAYYTKPFTIITVTNRVNVPPPLKMKITHGYNNGNTSIE